MSQPNTFISQVTARANTILESICNFAEGCITMMSLLYFSARATEYSYLWSPVKNEQTENPKQTKKLSTGLLEQQLRETSLLKILVV